MRFIISLFFRNQSEKVSLLIKALIKEFPLGWTSFIFTFTIIWTINLSLFELYLNYMTVMHFIYFILFYLNLWLNICFLNNFANTRRYPWIPANMKKIGGYPHNGYPRDMSTGTGHIFIQRVEYGRTTTRTLPAPLTSLVTSHLIENKSYKWNITNNIL